MKQTAYVIKRDDGKYYHYDDLYYDNIEYAQFFRKRSSSLHFINQFELENCRPVKVEIKEVEE